MTTQSLSSPPLTLRAVHVAMLLRYSGISFISGAVNHGFFPVIAHWLPQRLALTFLF